MAQYRIIKMLRATFEAQKEKALMTFELLMENPAGIGDHSTGDYYKNADEALTMLVDANDKLNALEDWYNDTAATERL